MRKWIWLIAAAPLAFAAAQTIQHETKTVNIEIPVRVFKGAAFVDTLRLDDFEVWDNGKPQKLEAVYLVKKTNIERREEATAFAPRMARHFTLIFEMSEFDPRLDEGLEFFMNNVLIPGDDLVVVTPMKTYRMRAEASFGQERSQILKRLVGLVRNDILIGNSEYRSLLEDLKAIAKSLAASITGSGSSSGNVPRDALANEGKFSGGSFEEQLQNYASCLSRFEALRQVDEKKFLEFARFLSTIEGQKDVFLFYQREFVPNLDPKIMNQFLGLYNDKVDVVLNVMNLFDFSKRDVTFDVGAVKRAFADSSTAIHFLFLTSQAEAAPGIVMEERTEDVFEPFREMARATGGFSEVSGNFEFIMKSAAAALENYYLLYYTPVGYKADGSFHELTVKVKSGGYRLAHRSGYIAD
jgi:VWFA-related protein